MNFDRTSNLAAREREIGVGKKMFSYALTQRSVFNFEVPINIRDLELSNTGMRLGP